ncbi:hypothetical protein GCM10007874_70330 [Labrys miyagiensis]|uniref:Uncharacterized protein n=1 Tax=Labrys miyagiensis TaxID=346912 RepID=A0ABQ6D0D3_9HYPH|nr:hypothetical protein GCM10007874_70330 [Labrys miyagiensis]
MFSFSPIAKQCKKKWRDGESQLPITAISPARKTILMQKWRLRYAGLKTGIFHICPRHAGLKTGTPPRPPLRCLLLETARSPAMEEAGKDACDPGMLRHIPLFFAAYARA